MEKTSIDDASIIGDECHIISSKPNGPRSEKILHPDEYDKPDNLLMLCKVHHKLVDDQEKTYTVEYLTKIKLSHEKWVTENLSPENENGDSIVILTRIKTGKELMSINKSHLAYIFEYDEPKDEHEMKTISEFLQVIQDWGDIWDVIGSGEQVQAGFGLSKSIKILEGMGFKVFGNEQKRKIHFPTSDEKWLVFIMVIARETNPAITPLGDLASIVNPT